MKWRNFVGSILTDAYIAIDDWTQGEGIGDDTWWFGCNQVLSDILEKV